jgi:hypothetical protein
MRSVTVVSLAVSLVFLSTSAFAQKKGKAAKKEAEGPSASATWTDPVENEKSDKAEKPEGQDDNKPANKRLQQNQNDQQNQSNQQNPNGNTSSQDDGDDDQQ